MDKLKQKAEELCLNMTANQLEKYCSRRSVWWEANSEYQLYQLQIKNATEALYRELKESLK